MKRGRPKSDKPTLRKIQKETSISIKTIQKYLLGNTLHMQHYTVVRLEKYFRIK